MRLPADVFVTGSNRRVRVRGSWRWAAIVLAATATAASASALEAYADESGIPSLALAATLPAMTSGDVESLVRGAITTRMTPSAPASDIAADPSERLASGGRHDSRARRAFR